MHNPQLYVKLQTRLQFNISTFMCTTLSRTP